MWRWLAFQGADHPRWNIFFGLVLIGNGVADMLSGKTAHYPWTWLGGGMIGLGAISVLMGVLGLYDRRRA